MATRDMAMRGLSMVDTTTNVVERWWWWWWETDGGGGGGGGKERDGHASNSKCDDMGCNV